MKDYQYPTDIYTEAEPDVNTLESFNVKFRCHCLFS